MRRGGVALAAALALFCCEEAPRGTGLDRSRLALAFAEEFDRAPDFWHAASNPKGRWKANYYFGVQDPNAPDGWQSRTLVPNQELQYYGDPHEDMDAFEWQDGVLDIVGQQNPYADDPRTGRLPYLSGLITTEKSFAQATGYFEARIAYPSGKGLWPAFWLLPVPDMASGRPQAAGAQEIDIFESIGAPGQLYFTIFADNGGVKIPEQQPVQTDLDLSQFHTYGLLLTRDEVVWYVDDREMHRAPNRDFHRPAYMLLNLALGGEWPGAPDATTPLPARMRIDWVRAYRFK